MDILRDDARRARPADRRDDQDRTVLDRLQLGGRLLLVAIFLEIAFEGDDLVQREAFGFKVVDGDVPGPAEMRVDAQAILGGEGDFHGTSSSSEWPDGVGAGEMAAGGADRCQVSGVGAWWKCWCISMLPIAKIRSRVPR